MSKHPITFDKEDKTTTSVHIYKAVVEHSRDNPNIKSLSDWINEVYPSDQMTLKSETDRLHKLCQEVEACKANIKNLKEMTKNSEISKKAQNFLKKEGPGRVIKFGLRGVLKYFNNEFGYEFNIRQFKILLKQYSGVN